MSNWKHISVESDPLKYNIGIDVRSIYTYGDTRYRILIHIDESYPQQTSGSIDRWDGSQWQDVYDCIGRKWGAVGKATDLEQFLLDRAADVIGDE